MNHRIHSIVIVAAALALGFESAVSYAQPASGLYRIEKGNYTEIGGFAGEWTEALPVSWQMFVELRSDGAKAFKLSILDEDRVTVFLEFTNGVVAGDTIVFKYTGRHPYWPEGHVDVAVDYAVRGNGPLLYLEGSIVGPPMCCDIVYLFQHAGVVARAELAPTIRVSEVEIGWESVLNAVYRVQWRSEATADQWTNLGGQVVGNGAVMRVVDKVPAGAARRFYRVLYVR